MKKLAEEQVALRHGKRHGPRGKPPAGGSKPVRQATTQREMQEDLTSRVVRTSARNPGPESQNANTRVRHAAIQRNRSNPSASKW